MEHFSVIEDALIQAKAAIEFQAAKIQKLEDALEQIRDQEDNHALDIRCKCTEFEKLAEARMIAKSALFQPEEAPCFTQS